MGDLRDQFVTAKLILAIGVGGILTGFGLNGTPMSQAAGVSGVAIKFMACCPQVKTTDNQGLVVFSPMARGNWSVFVLSTIRARADVFLANNYSHTLGIAEPNQEAVLQASNQIHRSDWIGILLVHPGGSYPVAGQRVRIVPCCVRAFSTNASGVSQITGVQAGSWQIETTAASPVHIEISGAGVSPTSFDMPIAGTREHQVTVSGSGTHTVTITATPYAPPILVRPRPGPGTSPRN